MNSRYTKFDVSKRYGVVMCDNPPITSLASLAKLSRQLANQDKTLYDPFKWLRFRKKYLEAILAKEGTITCHYCGKQKLKIVTKNRKMLTTLDHYHPVSRGGDVYDLDNIVPSCYNCNIHKGNTIIKGRK